MLPSIMISFLVGIRQPPLVTIRLPLKDFWELRKLNEALLLPRHFKNVLGYIKAEIQHSVYLIKVKTNINQGSISVHDYTMFYKTDLYPTMTMHFPEMNYRNGPKSDVLFVLVVWSSQFTDISPPIIRAMDYARILIDIMDIPIKISMSWDFRTLFYYNFHLTLDLLVMWR